MLKFQDCVPVYIVAVVIIAIALVTTNREPTPETTIDTAFLLPFANPDDSVACLEQAAKTINGQATTYSDCSRAIVANYLRGK